MIIHFFYHEQSGDLQYIAGDLDLVDLLAIEMLI
jgi:hypothetical protein